jgi:cytidine deaminase
MNTTSSSLRDVALQVRDNAYAPYSGFKVGAAIEMDDGSIFGGANVENAAYPQTICAERSAIASAVAAGKGRKGAIKRVYVVADPIATPCGGCRSMLGEFGTHDTEITIATPGGASRTFTLKELLPFSFELGDNPLED